MTALREWLPAIRRLPGYRMAAVSAVGQAPDSVRSVLLRQLDHADGLPGAAAGGGSARTLGRPAGALETLERSLPADRGQAIEALRALLDQLRLRPGRDVRLVTGRALELIAERSSPAERARLRLDAARAYTAAGERDAARRMLTGIADDRTAPGAVSSGATSTLVQVLIAEGRLDEAASRLAEHRGEMLARSTPRCGAASPSVTSGAGDLARADSAHRR